MKRQPEGTLALHCYAYLKGNLYYAECVDLGIVVAKPKMREAMAALEDSIDLTLESASAHGFLDQVLRRKSPWRSRMRYHWIGMLIHIDKWLGSLNPSDGPQPVRFQHRCAAHA